MGSLDGKTALVTGGSRGIGRAIAVRLAADGALVAVHYGSNEAAAKETVAAIEAAGGRAFAVGADLAEAAAVDALWAAFEAGSRDAGAEPGLDILVNNAAVATSSDLGGVTVAEFDRLFAVNVRAPLFLVQRGRTRLRDGGRIINISSGVTRIALPDVLPYSMTKGALEVFTLTLAKELGERGITVNSVAPGFVDTDINASWMRTDPAAKAAAAAYSVFNRVGEPGDIADVVAFLASPGARWITGQTVDATGGSQL